MTTLKTPRPSRHKADAAAVIQALRRLFKAVHVYSKSVLRTTGLSGPQLWALTILQEEPGLSLRDLAARMYAHPSTVSGVVERLVKQRAVKREVHPSDRREIRLTLTETGTRLIKKSPTPVQAALTQALCSMPASRLRQLRKALEDVAQSTEADHLDAPFYDIE
jgi:MarR family transcriptional regulator, organic hydroperoxide resistance regulator